MVFITGDIHGEIDIAKLNTKNFPIQKELTKKDVVIVCGDFGNVWYPSNHPNYRQDLYWQKWLKNKSFTTLFVDGNHENFELLNKLPEIEFMGGKVGKVTDGVYHLKRGEIYTIEGKRFFCFGGASSHDKQYRKEGISWWPEELANNKEMNYAVDNLEENGWEVDYIISHCCPTKIANKILSFVEPDSMTQFFKFLSENLRFTKWFFGHYHRDVEIESKYICLYQNIYKL